MMHCVYKLICRVNGKVYVGKTNDPHRRYIEHASTARRGGNRRLCNAIRKHGWENFGLHILAEFDCAEDAYQAEIFFIALFNATGRQGYNSTEGGEGTRGLTEEGRERLSAFAKTRTGERNPFFGRSHTEEAKQKMAAAMARFRGQNHPRWAKSHSEETKRKISATKTGQRRWSEEERHQIGLRSAGEKSGTAKITNAQAVELRQLFSQGVPARNLQTIFGLSKAAVYRVVNRQTFKEC